MTELGDERLWFCQSASHSLLTLKCCGRLSHAKSIDFATFKMCHSKHPVELARTNTSNVHKLCIIHHPLRSHESNKHHAACTYRSCVIQCRGRV